MSFSTQSNNPFVNTSATPTTEHIPRSQISQVAETLKAIGQNSSQIAQSTVSAARYVEASAGIIAIQALLAMNYNANLSFNWLESFDKIFAGVKHLTLTTEQLEKAQALERLIRAGLQVIQQHNVADRLLKLTDLINEALQQLPIPSDSHLGKIQAILNEKIPLLADNTRTPTDHSHTPTVRFVPPRTESPKPARSPSPEYVMSDGEEAHESITVEEVLHHKALHLRQCLLSVFPPKDVQILQPPQNFVTSEVGVANDPHMWGRILHKFWEISPQESFPFRGVPVPIVTVGPSDRPLFLTTTNGGRTIVYAGTKKKLATAVVNQEI